MLTFNTIDVETANADRASICQIGIVHVQDGEIIGQWQSLINPEDWFDEFNVGIHGIDEHAVIDSPTFPDVYDELHGRLRGSFLVSHGSFDRTALERAWAIYDLEPLDDVKWVNSVVVGRQIWPHLPNHKLRTVANHLGVLFNHHDALEDAKAAAKVILHACAASETGIEEWQHIARPKRKTFPKSVPSIKREEITEGALDGETVIFTGALSITRDEISELAAYAGSKVVATVSKKITMLVVGMQDKDKLLGYEKSTKHRKVETLIVQGADIQILSEGDFLELLGIG